MSVFKFALFSLYMFEFRMNYSGHWLCWSLYIQPFLWRFQISVATKRLLNHPVNDDFQSRLKQTTLLKWRTNCCRSRQIYLVNVLKHTDWVKLSQIIDIFIHRFYPNCLIYIFVSQFVLNFEPSNWDSNQQPPPTGSKTVKMIEKRFKELQLLTANITCSTFYWKWSQQQQLKMQNSLGWTKTL